MTNPHAVAVASSVADFDRKTFALTADFIEAAIDDARILEGIPHGAVLVLLPDDASLFVEDSIALGLAAIRQGRDVVFRHTAEIIERAKTD